jgi:hypothetical protein
MKIKKYSQFVKKFFESLDDFDSFRMSIERLKLSLALNFKPIFEKETEIRQSGDKKTIESSADQFMQIMFDLWYYSVMNRRDLEDSIKELIIHDFDDALDKSRDIFINKSFNDGLISTLELLCQKLEQQQKSKGSEDESEEEWRIEKEVDYSDMTNREINDLINAAIDSGDFERASYLNQFIKVNESMQITDEMTEVVGDFCEQLLDIIIKFY